MAEEDILIRIRAIDEATQTIQKVSKSLGQISTSTQQLTTGFGKVQRTIVKTYTPAVAGFNSMEEATSAAGISMSKFNNFARMNFLEVQKGGIVMDKLTGQTMSYGKAAKDATIQGRRFKFEWLSIMFAGMALDRAFGGLVKTQLQLFGVTDLMGTAWTIVLLPIMEKIVPLLYDMIDIFMNLPEPVKLAIGGFVLFGAILGKIFTVIGQVVLAFMGFTILDTTMPILAKFGGAVKGIGGIVKGLTSAIAGLGATAGIVIAAVVAVVVGMYLAWKENFMGMKQVVQDLVDGAKQSLGGLLSIFKGLFKILKGILTGDFELIIEGLKNIFKGFLDYLVGHFKMAFNSIKAIIIGALKILYNIVNLLFEIGARIGNLLTGKGFVKMGALKLPEFQLGGIVPRTGPALLHAGERVIPRHEVERERPTTTIAPIVTYNITVQDKFEMERLMKDNNFRLVEQIKRQVNL